MAMFQHTLGIFTNPDREWQRIRSEEQSFFRVYWTHVPLLALIPVICAYFGVTQQGWSIGNGGVVKLTSDSALILCGFAYLAQLAAVYILGEYINWMSQSFGVSDEPNKRHYEGTALAVYSAAPMMLAGVVLLWPELWLVAGVFIAAACYSIYLIYEGIPILMNIPQERGFIYASSVITVGLVLAIVVMVATVIVWASGMGPIYVS
ncbi:YIP1 family protein [Gilvimarinus agarilyticus]|uniref:Yip1 family protein n=1 Tax=unclassified Gilvimarinus TaxID=2642066 RepID=UPI001C08BAFD|nr:MULTISPECIES: Yip1 family protein [unclassified Gilvimarinus]MBU2887631.1 YIP1 family protein [Gilvimarinus agarilyticus]MDO6572282.1 Yip1 family protein [Gilvimarinus sp. 2_MG-2023]MDO6746849.1 Yip1 family protein [Gilvimarinus sp. 1_MG-2023]